MALPKLNDSPQYELTIPSTQKTVRYRPYLIKEEKVMMIAMESQDQKQILNAIADTIIACVEEPVTKAQLTTFDVEYMFLQIRAKSVGETVKLTLPCTSCEHKTEMSIRLDDITVNVPPKIASVQLNDDISIDLAYPNYLSMMKDDIVNTKSPTEQAFALIADCISYVNMSDEKIKFSEESKAERNAFIESLNASQFNKIREFVDSIPRMSKKVEWDCESCGHHNEITLEGISDFF